MPVHLSHDASQHAVCLEDIHRIATKRCNELGLRLTDKRLTVLKALAQNHHACGAYEIIETIAQQSGHQLAPTAIYRALEFWQKVGLVHKIGGLDRYCACFNTKESHSHFVVCCDQCFKVQELCDHRAGFDLLGTLEGIGYALNSVSKIEVIARCKACT